MKAINQQSTAASLNRWKAVAQNKAAEAAKAKQQPDFTYQQAMEKFEQDVSDLKSWDGKLQSGPYGIGTKRDINPEPGQVEVPGLGKLVSTDDGGWEAEISSSSRPAIGNTHGCFASSKRSYSVNASGSITVLEESKSGTFHGTSEKSRLYTLDPEKGEISDFTSSSSRTDGFYMKTIKNSNSATTSKETKEADKPKESTNAEKPMELSLGQRAGQALETVLSLNPFGPRFFLG